MLRGVQTTITPGAGKNTSSRRGQASERDDDDVKDSGGTVVGKRGELKQIGTQQGQAGMSPAELKALGDAQEKERNAGITITKEAEDLRRQQEKEIGQQKGQPATKGGSKSMPNPETDTGSDHGTKGIITERTGKSPSELEAERKRQVTLPSDDQSRQQERVRAKRDDALKEGIRQRTDGRINPDRSGEAGASGAPVAPPGSGLEQVDRLGGKRGGTTPDNPTAAK